MLEHPLLFPIGGFIAGFIDSIAGGGGLITLPLLSLSLGAGAEAIASNKIVGTLGAASALLIYSRKGYLRLREGLPFVAAIAAGSLLGSAILPLVPKDWIRWAIIAASPLLLWTLWQKERWAKLARRARSPGGGESRTKTVLSGLACGVYDGAFGPGGGTFMFLALAFVVELPLLPALAASKLANTFSAGSSLVSYWWQGLVHWGPGLGVGAGMFLGAFLGAQLASRNAERIIRPVLVLAVLLLLARLL